MFKIQDSYCIFMVQGSPEHTSTSGCKIQVLIQVHTS